MAKTPVKKPDATPVQPSCGNCAYATGSNGSTMVVCGIDLPPMVNTSGDPRRHMANRNYRCAFHKMKD